MIAKNFDQIMRQVGPDGLTGYQRRARTCVANKLAKDPEAMKKHAQKMLATMGTEGIKKRAETLNKTIEKKSPMSVRRAIRKYRNRVAFLSRKNDLSDLPNFECWGERYHLDHRFSVIEGFRRNIPPEIIAHKYNLEFLPVAENRAKWKSCSITLEELLENYHHN